MTKYLFILFTLSFSRGAIELLGVSPTWTRTTVDVLVLLFIIAVIMSSKNMKLPYLSYFVLFSLSLLLSALFNGSVFMGALSFFRHTFLMYFFFIAILNCEFKIEFSKLNSLIFILLLLQIFASILKYFIHGIDEKIVGTISYQGGSLNAVVPLIAIGSMFLYYLNYKKSMYLVIILGFLFMAFVGEKRGFWVYLPILLLIITWIYYGKLKQLNFAKYAIVSLPFLIVASMIVMYFGTRLMPLLNPDGIVWGRFDYDYVVDHALNYSGVYTTDQALPTGRYGTTVATFNHFLDSDATNQLIGYGPDVFIGKSNSDQATEEFGALGITQYTGFSFYLTSLGLLGTLSVILLILSILKNLILNFRQDISKQKFFIFGLAIVICVVTIMDFFLYSRASIQYNTIYFLLAYSAALAFRTTGFHKSQLI